tara:strand:- start:619 stop:777 length:159 start_codon:yes stop_codon:yes gene_type:complete
LGTYVLDGLIYSAAAIIRLRRMKNVNNTSNDNDISNKRINKINNNTAFPFYI